MIERRRRADAHEFLGADLDHGNTGIVVEVRNDVIGHLGERPDAAKLLVIVSARPLDSVPSATALRRVQADLLAQGRGSQIRLDAFTRDEVASYLDARFGHDLAAEAASVLYRTTNGNPLFLATAADHLVGRRGLHGEAIAEKLPRREGQGTIAFHDGGPAARQEGRHVL